ncbi:MAG: hypothetical protein E6R04_03545 [Spirochaetes bacterium]|nr:MAG: hypothetical protein E6R04_03545 [Spirochaetota bacterium]
MFLEQTITLGEHLLRARVTAYPNIVGCSSTENIPDLSGKGFRYIYLDGRETLGIDCLDKPAVVKAAQESARMYCVPVAVTYLVMKAMHAALDNRPTNDRLLLIGDDDVFLRAMMSGEKTLDALKDVLTSSSFDKEGYFPPLHGHAFLIAQDREFSAETCTGLPLIAARLSDACCGGTIMVSANPPPAFRWAGESERKLPHGDTDIYLDIDTGLAAILPPSEAVPLLMAARDQVPSRGVSDVVAMNSLCVEVVASLVAAYAVYARTEHDVRVTAYGNRLKYEKSLILAAAMYNTLSTVLGLNT